MKDYQGYRQKKNNEYAQQKPQRLELRNGNDAEEPCGELRDFLFLCPRINAGPRNNGRLTGNVRLELVIDQTNPWIAGHVVWSFAPKEDDVRAKTCLTGQRDRRLPVSYF